MLGFPTQIIPDKCKSACFYRLFAVYLGMKNKDKTMLRDYTVNNDLTIKHGEVHEYKGKTYTGLIQLVRPSIMRRSIGITMSMVQPCGSYTVQIVGLIIRSIIQNNAK